MNLVGTLAKVAMGVLVARGVGKMINKGRSTGSPAGGNPSGQMGGGSIGGGSIQDAIGGRSSQPQSSQPSDGDLRDLLEGLNRGKSQQSGSASQSGGGLGDLLGKVLSGGATNQSTQQGRGGSLDDLLKGIGRGQSQSSGRGAQPQTQQRGGLDDLLESIKQSGAGTSSGGAPGGLGGILGKVLAGGGGLGGILESLGGGKSQVQSPKRPDNGSLGDLLNQALGGKTTREPPPEQNTQAEIMLRGMINAAKSDREIDKDEQAKILSNLGDATREEIDFIRKEMAQPLDIHAFIRSVPKGLEQQVYMMSLLAIKLDSKAEAEYLDHLAQGLGISHEAANQLHAQVGAPNLYR